MSFPNPLMLPFLAAGGAISGSSFGLFYTVLMQIGYNYYGKRALKQMEDGRKLQDVLMDISKEVQPFSDQMMEIALAKMPDVIDKSVVAFEGLITQRIKNLQKTLVGEQSGISEFDKMVLGWFGIQTAEARRGSPGLGGAIIEAAPPPPVAKPVPPPVITGVKHVEVTPNITGKSLTQLKQDISQNENRIKVLLQEFKLKTQESLPHRRIISDYNRATIKSHALQQARNRASSLLKIINARLKAIAQEVDLLVFTNKFLNKHLLKVTT